MAINFLNTVAFNQNSLEKPRIENQPNNATAGTGVEGQLYFDTTVDALKIWAGGAWIEVGATSGVETFTNANGTYVANSIVNTSAIGNVSTGTVDLTAVDGTSSAASRFLTKDNKWATIPFGDVTEVQGGLYINVTDQTGPIPIVNHDLTTRTNTANASSPGYGGDIIAVDSITTNSTGHITGVNTKTYTLPADTNETYTLPTTSGVVAPGAPTTGIISLTAGGTGSGIKNTVTFTGTSSRIDVSGSAAGINGAITINLTDDVTIVDDLDVGGVITQIQTGELNTFSSKLDMGGTGSVTPNKIINLATGTAATDAVNLGQVELLVAGVGVFQGSYNAATNTPALEGGSNVALDQGDYFVVSVSGSFLGEALEPGDFIFANNAIAANSSPALSNYTVVQADDNIAGAGATDGATQKGVSGFDSAYFDVSTNGWVQLNSQRNPYGYKQVLNNTAPSSRAESGGVTTFTIDITKSAVGVSPAWEIFGAGALAENVKVEVTSGSAPYQTVYADVSRSGSATLSIAFTGSVANSAYQVLLSHI